MVVRSSAAPEPVGSIRRTARYIVTPRVTKHRLFVRLSTRVCPDSATIAIARDDGRPDNRHASNPSHRRGGPPRAVRHLTSRMKTLFESGWYSAAASPVAMYARLGPVSSPGGRSAAQNG